MLAFPYLLKFLWAPLVDRFGSVRWGHYRSWLVPLTTLSVAAVVLLAVLQPGAALKPDATTSLVVGVVLLTALFMFTSATQDAATDGLAVRLVSSRQRGAANGVQVGGYYLGQILGGGMVLVLFARLGWTGALLSMALLLSLPLIPLARLREPRLRAATASGERGPEMPGFQSLARFFRRPGIVLWVTILIVYRAGEAMALAMLNPMLVDRGYSLTSVGLAVGLVGSIASLGGALAGGVITQALGRRRALALLGVTQSVAILTYIAPATTGSWALVLIAVSVASAAGGAATSALYTSMMDRCNPTTAASDFTVQQSLCALGPLLAVGLSGVSAAALGYVNHFLLCAGISLAAAVAVALFVTAQHGAAAPASGARTA
jgi:predicted MFS family arabinose efflux permease